MEAPALTGPFYLFLCVRLGQHIQAEGDGKLHIAF